MTNVIIRILFPDTSYSSVRLKFDTTVAEIIARFCPKKGLNPDLHTLKVCEKMERTLSDRNSGRKTLKRQSTLQRATPNFLKRKPKMSGQTFERLLQPFEKPFDIISKSSKTSQPTFHVVSFMDEEESEEESDEGFIGYSDIQAMGYQKQGWMEKLGVDTLVLRFNMWRRNFFVLDGDSLHYWKSELDFKTSQQPKGTIELQTPWTYVKVNEKCVEGKWMFQLITVKKIVYLRVETYRDMVEWCNALFRPPPKDLFIFEVLQHEVEQTERVRAEEFGHWTDSFSKLETIIEYRPANEAFLRFLRQEDREHWLLFLLDVDQFQQITDQQRLQLFFRRLCHVYIEKSASLPECTRNLRMEILQTYKQISDVETSNNDPVDISWGFLRNDFFNDIRDMVKEELKRTSFPLFLWSSDFKNFISKRKFKRKMWPPDLKGS